MSPLPRHWVQAAGLLLLRLPSLTAAPEVCPREGGLGCSAADAIPDKDLRCSGWRQTGACSPKGNREPHGDLPCHSEVQSGSSGYCECAGGRHAREATCGHRVFNCDDECRLVRQYVCVAWRQTGDCSADGGREPDQDKSCDEAIDSGMSGFCECGGGRTVRKPGCEAGQLSDAFRCRDECARELSPYEELGVDISASDKMIKQAFRKLSLKFHPDKTRSDPTATARFTAIREAYDVISDPEQRNIYDAGGIQMVSEARGQKLQKGPAMAGEVLISLEGLYNGEDIRTSVRRKVICKGCADQWTARCEQCTAGCANEIQLVRMQLGPMIVQQQQEVASKQRCRLMDAVLDVAVERGMASGDKIVFKGMGEQRPQMIPGDIELTLREKKHEVFRRTGADLHTEISISLKEALLGFERRILQLDRRNIIITISGVTKPFEIIRVDGEGMPHRGDPTQHGNLFVKCRIVMPTEAQLEPQWAWLRDNFPA